MAGTQQLRVPKAVEIENLAGGQPLGKQREGLKEAASAVGVNRPQQGKNRDQLEFPKVSSK